MTSVTTAPTSGWVVPPARTRRAKTASGGADRVLRFSLRSGGLLALLIMSTIGSQFVFAPAAFAQGYAPISARIFTQQITNWADPAIRGDNRQQQAEALGYACNNPTVSPDGTDLLAKNAPQPPDCDCNGGPAQCTPDTGGVPTPTPPIGGPPVPPRGPPAPPTTAGLTPGLVIDR